jgi:hypothetical protein
LTWLEQAHADFVLQRTQMAADHRVVEAELLGGAPNAEVPADRIEHLQRFQTRQHHAVLPGGSLMGSRGVGNGGLAISSEFHAI